MEAEAAAVDSIEQKEPMEVETAPDATAEEPVAAEPAAKPAGEKKASEPAEEKDGDEGEGKEEKTPAKKGRAAKPKPTPATAGGTGTGGRARRERKQIDRFAPVVAVKNEDAVAMPEGKGAKLRDIPNVAFKMGKLTGKHELLEDLHMVIFRRKGAALQRKKNVLDFSGFAFPPEQQEKELKSRRESLAKLKLDTLHKLLDTLDLPRGSGDKAAKVDKLLEWLSEPRATSDVDLAAKEADRKAKEKAKKERAAAKKEKESAKKEKASAAKRKSAGAAKGRPAKKAKKEGEDEEDEAEEEGAPSEPEEEEEESEGDEGSDFEAELPASRKKQQRGSKRGGRRRKAENEEEEGGEAMEEDGEPEAEEQPADAASKLTATQLRAEVEAVLGALDPAELTAITPKVILAKLEEKHGYSFKSRKAEVKDVSREFVLKYVEEHPELQAGDEEAPAAQGGADADSAPAELTTDAPAAAAEEGSNEEVARAPEDGEQEAAEGQAEEAPVAAEAEGGEGAEGEAAAAAADAE